MPNMYDVKLDKGDVIAGREILGLYSTLGKNRFFRVRCVVCKHISIMSVMTLVRNRKCKKCLIKGFNARLL